MRIPLRKKFLNIELKFKIFMEPNLRKLESELEGFFENNEIEGHTIKTFGVDRQDMRYVIIPGEPPLEEALSGGDYRDAIRDIGLKYGIDNLGFVYWCYHK